jgi:hypothetical protein
MDDAIKEKHERWVGDTVIQYYNSAHGTDFRFHGRAGVAPDLEYRDEARSLRVEVVTAYYDDAEDAKFKWLSARKRPDAPKKWSGVDFEKNLVKNINSALSAKSTKSYGPDCVLAVCVLPQLTFADEMESLLNDVRIPDPNPFDGIYLCGQFPAPIGNPAECKVWRVA